MTDAGDQAAQAEQSLIASFGEQVVYFNTVMVQFPTGKIEEAEGFRCGGHSTMEAALVCAEMCLPFVRLKLDEVQRIAAKEAPAAGVAAHDIGKFATGIVKTTTVLLEKS